MSETNVDSEANFENQPKPNLRADSSFELLQVMDSKRDLAWEEAFLKGLPYAHLTVLDEDPQMGPDGFPYLLVGLERDGTEPGSRVLSWLKETGIGLVINPEKHYPDYILSYGMIVNFAMRGRFFEPEDIKPQGEIKKEIEPSKGQAVYAVPLSQSQIPEVCLNFVGDFLRHQAIVSPLAAFLSWDGKTYDLAFDIESMGSELNAKDQEQLANALRWFLPGQCNVAFVKQSSLPAEIRIFSPLKSDPQ